MEEQPAQIPDTEKDITPNKPIEDTPITNEVLIQDQPKYNYHKRRYIQIRQQIIKSIKEFPKSSYELSKDLKVSRITIQRHIEYLESIGIIKKTPFKLRKGIKELWTLIWGDK